MIWFTSVVLSLSNLGISDFLTCSEEKFVCETEDNNKDVALQKSDLPLKMKQEEETLSLHLRYNETLFSVFLDSSYQYIYIYIYINNITIRSSAQRCHSSWIWWDLRLLQILIFSFTSLLSVNLRINKVSIIIIIKWSNVIEYALCSLNDLHN